MSQSSRHRLSPGVMAVVAVLLAIPVLALVLVPIYARKGPELWGFPFFYWYQFLWVFLAAGFTYAAFLVIETSRGRGGKR